MLGIKLFLVMLIIVPATIITILIWMFGGWAQGWDYMPNPVYALLEWLDK